MAEARAQRPCGFWRDKLCTQSAHGGITEQAERYTPAGIEDEKMQVAILDLFETNDRPRMTVVLEVERRLRGSSYRGTVADHEDVKGGTVAFRAVCAIGFFGEVALDPVRKGDVLTCAFARANRVER